MINIFAAGGTEAAGYKLVLVLHILAIVTAFGTPFAYSAINRVAQQRGGDTGGAIADVPPTLHKLVALPALVIAMVLGVILVGISDNRWDFGDAWLSASFTVAILLLVWSWFMVIPSLQRFAAGVRTGVDEAKKAKGMAAMSTGVYHLGLVVLVFLMVWKPGS